MLLAYIRGNSIYNIKCKLISLYILNVSDILLTLILIETGYFIEANPIIATFIEQPIKLILIKILLPALLLLYIYSRIKKAITHQLIISNTIINGALLSYGFINLLHIFWFMNLLFLS